MQVRLIILQYGRREHGLTNLSGDWVGPREAGALWVIFHVKKKWRRPCKMGDT